MENQIKKNIFWTYIPENQASIIIRMYAETA